MINTNNIEECEICKCNYSIQKKKHIMWNKIVSYMLFIIILAAFYILIFVKYNENIFLFFISIICIISLCVAITYLNHTMFVTHTIVLHELYDNSLDSNTSSSNGASSNTSSNGATSNTSNTSNETIPLINS